MEADLFYSILGKSNLRQKILCKKDFKSFPHENKQKEKKFTNR